IVADGANGVAVAAANATITNAGTIQALNGSGIFSDVVATVTNLSGGLITGGAFGIKASGLDITDALGATISGGITGITGSGIIRSAGTISGGMSSILFIGATGTNTLVLQTGALLNGDAVGSTAGATNNLVLQGSGIASNNFLGFNTLDVQAGGT